MYKGPIIKDSLIEGGMHEGAYAGAMVIINGHGICTFPAGRVS